MIRAVLLGEKLDTASQKVVNVGVGEDLQGYRGDDQVGGLWPGSLIYLEHVDDG